MARLKPGDDPLPLNMESKVMMFPFNPTPYIGGAVATYDPPLDEGIREYVEVLGAAGIETFESCEGGPGHAYPEPTVRFHGEQGEGFRALAVAQSAGLPIAELRRTWPVLDDEPTGPWWELTFSVLVD